MSSSAIAQQQQTFRQQLAGTWEVVSLGSESPAAKSLSTNPKGYMVLAGSGKYVLVLRNPNSPKRSGAMGMAASFGTWSVDEGTKTLTRHIEGSMANSEGTDAKATIVISGDELRATSLDGKVTNVLKRVRQ
jgi:hypothetical protein